MIVLVPCEIIVFSGINFDWSLPAFMPDFFSC
jgi:hypothetical protein